jgi:hypothetical protein
MPMSTMTLIVIEVLFFFFSRTSMRAVYLCIKKKIGQEPLQHTSMRSCF